LALKSSKASAFNSLFGIVSHFTLAHFL